MDMNNMGMNKGKKKFPAFILFLVLSLVLAASGFASSGESAHGPTVMDWVWKVVNFALLFIILVKFGRKPLKDFLANRTKLIEKSLNEAKEAKELAQKALEEVQKRLKNKDKEIEEIISSAKASGEREREALIKEGERLSERALEQAKTNIDYELKQARETIKAEAVELAMELAEKKLKDRLTPEEQKRLIEESMAKLEAHN